jgi:hypothetical protein
MQTSEDGGWRSGTYGRLPDEVMKHFALLFFFWIFPLSKFQATHKRNKHKTPTLKNKNIKQG